MNIFWERLSYTMNKKDAEKSHPKCKEFIEFCRTEKDFSTENFGKCAFVPMLKGIEKK